MCLISDTSREGFDGNRVAKSRLEFSDSSLVAAFASAETLRTVVHSGVFATTFKAWLDRDLDGEVAFFAFFHDFCLWLAGASESATCLLYCIRLDSVVLRARIPKKPLLLPRGSQSPPNERRRIFDTPQGRGP